MYEIQRFATFVLQQILYIQFSVVTIRDHCVTPQEMLKVRRHQDLRYYFFSSHAIYNWNISQQSVIDFSSVNQG